MKKTNDNREPETPVGSTGLVGADSVETITINKEVLYKLAASHSDLAKDEYDRNPSINSNAPSHHAEADLITELNRLGLFDELMEYMMARTQAHTEQVELPPREGSKQTGDANGG